MCFDGGALARAQYALANFRISPELFIFFGVRSFIADKGVLLVYHSYEWLTCEQASVNNRKCGAHVTNYKHIVTGVLSIVHCRVLFPYCIILTKGQAGLLKLDWMSLSEIAILLCTFIVHSGVKLG